MIKVIGVVEDRVMTKEKKTRHSLIYFKRDNSWVLRENRLPLNKHPGKHLKTFYTQDFKTTTQAASEVISRVKQLLGSSLTELRVYTTNYKLIKTISFSGVGNENTL